MKNFLDNFVEILIKKVRNIKNPFISNLNKKKNFTTNLGLFLRRKFNRPWRKLCNIFTKANIIKTEQNKELSDDEYFNQLSTKTSNLESCVKKGENNLIIERYPDLDKKEQYIFFCNHTCPEDIEIMLNVLDRNAYVVLGSVESLKYNREMYLLWLNGMIPFDILNAHERAELYPKMERVLKTNSLLIFSEASHNYNNNKVVNNLYEGMINLSLKTGRKIVSCAMVRDENKYYIDVSNPIDISKVNINIQDYYPGKEENEKYFIKSLARYIRDKNATAVFNMLLRHLKLLERKSYEDIEEHFREEIKEEVFKKLKWLHDVFDAEYLVKKTEEEMEYEDVIKVLSDLRLSLKTLKSTQISTREYVLIQKSIERNDVASFMRGYWEENIKEKPKVKKRNNLY